MHKRLVALATFAVFSVSACASPSAEYPSLAIRDAERLNGNFTAGQPEGESPAANAPAARDLAERLLQLQAEAQSAHQGFLAIAPRAANLVAAAQGAGLGSRPWASAQVAISELDSQRSLTAIALADLDLLYAAQAVELVERSRIAEAQSAVAALIAEEDRMLAKLKGDIAQ